MTAVVTEPAWLNGLVQEDANYFRDKKTGLGVLRIYPGTGKCEKLASIQVTPTYGVTVYRMNGRAEVSWRGGSGTVEEADRFADACKLGVLLACRWNVECRK